MASFGFDVFTGDLVRALCSGGKLVICPKETMLEPEELLDLMHREQVKAPSSCPSFCATCSISRKHGPNAGVAAVGGRGVRRLARGETTAPKQSPGGPHAADQFLRTDGDDNRQFVLRGRRGAAF